MRPDSIRASLSECRMTPERRMMVCWCSYGPQMKSKNIDQVPYIAVRYTDLSMGTSIPGAHGLDCMTFKSLLATKARLHGLMEARHSSRQAAGEQWSAERRAQWNEMLLEW